MKPRGKRMQRQNGRMYLRKCDHRDVIIPDFSTGKDAYHNIIYYIESEKDKDGKPKKDKDGKVITKEYLAWQKYPEKLVYFGMHIGGDNGNRGEARSVWLDVERHFLYMLGRRAYAGANEQTMRTKDYVLEMSTEHYWSTEYTSFAASTDAMVYHKDEHNTRVPVDMANAWTARVGDNGVIVITTGSSYPYWHLYLRRVQFTIDEDTEKFTSTTVELPTLDFENSVGTNYGLGYDQDDERYIIARGTIRYDHKNPYIHPDDDFPGSGYPWKDDRLYWVFYKLNEYGSIERLGSSIHIPDRIIDVHDFGSLLEEGALHSMINHAGQLYMGIHRMVEKRKGFNDKGALVDKYIHKLYFTKGLPILASLDPIITNEETLITESSSNPFTWAFVSRKSGLYCFVYDSLNGKVSLFKKQVNNWFKMNLPSYRDIPISTDGGEIISGPGSTYTTLRVIFDRENPGPEIETPKPDLGDIDLGDLDIDIDIDIDIDPEMSVLKINFWNYMSSTTFNNSTFFDRGEMQENDESDYGLMFSGSVNNMNGFFVYTPTIDFEKHDDLWAALTALPSSTSNPAYDYVIEGDYMFTNYMETDGQSSYGTDMYIWHDKDDKKGTEGYWEVLDQGRMNWEDYAKYEMVNVKELPETGQKNKIYVVKRRYPASQTNRYVWNNWKRTFESLQVTTVDLNQTFRELQVPYLPKKGEEGIIYILPSENSSVPPGGGEAIDPQTTFTRFVYVDGMFMEPGQAGVTNVDLVSYTIEYVVNLPLEGEAKKLYLVPVNKNPSYEE